MASIQKLSSENLSIPLITNCQELLKVWEIQRYIMRSQQRQLMTPEIQKFCSKEVKQKILWAKNEYLGIILHRSLQNVVSYLRARNYRFKIYTYLSVDPYIPKWEGITVFIRVNYRNFREKMRVWREIERKITKIIDEFRRLNSKEDLEKIEEANETIATTVEKL